MPSTYTLNEQLRALGWTLNLTRLNIILLLITSVLLWVAQGQDLLLNMVDGAFFASGETLLNRVSLFGSTALWALSIWLWARVLLSIRFPQGPVIAPELLLPYCKHLPRALAVIAFATVAINLARAVPAPYGYYYAAAMAFEGLLVWWLLVKRRDYARRFIARGDRNHWAWVDELDDPFSAPPMRDSLREALQGIQGRIAVFTAVLGVLMLAWGLIAPLSLGNSLDTLLLLMLWGATLLPWGSALTYWGNRNGYPVVLLLVGAVLLFSFWNDNHPVRVLADSPHKPEDRATFDQAIETWKQQNCNTQGCPKFVFVATAGGGIRAAYWTGTLLGQIHDQAKPGRLGERLFGVSGVSGGSVGATIYRAVAQARTQSGATSVTEQVQAILGRDYLGPVSAGLLYHDLLQALLPIPVLTDRAKVFEQSLETGFSGVVDQGDGLRASLIGSAAQDRHWPALFLNSTWSDNGRRIVGATVQAPEAVLYQDLLQTQGKDLRLSTAAHNSARFPLVSPAGYWIREEQPNIKQRLQDGGLFENYGAETALEILEAARRNLGRDFHPLVILITSDPRLHADIAKPMINQPLAFAPELLSTFHTYAQTRLGRGAEAASRLKNWATHYGDDAFAYFRMCGDGEFGKEPPLGWSLSQSAQKDIREYLHSRNPDACRQDNLNNLNNVVNAINLDLISTP